MSDAAPPQRLVRRTVAVSLAVAILSLSACASTWEADVPATGYAMCSDDPAKMTVTYESGPGVESAKALQSATLGEVFLFVRITGSGEKTTGSSPASFVTDLDGPLYDRSVVTLDDQPVPEVDC